MDVDMLMGCDDEIDAYKPCLLNSLHCTSSMQPSGPQEEASMVMLCVEVSHRHVAPGETRQTRPRFFSHMAFQANFVPSLLFVGAGFGAEFIRGKKGFTEDSQI